MDRFQDYLLNFKRDDIPDIGKLGELSNSDLKRILSKTNINEYLDKNIEFDNVKDNCWIWTSPTVDIGKGHCHGSIWYNKKFVMTHRIMFHNFIENVPIYERKAGVLQVNHRCNTDGKCVNPWHMYLGTPKQNTEDSIRDGTATLFRRQVSDEQYQEILGLKGLNINEVATRYNVSTNAIRAYWKKQ